MRRQAEIDHERAEYVRRLYGADWLDATHYDLRAGLAIAAGIGVGAREALLGVPFVHGHGRDRRVHRIARIELQAAAAPLLELGPVIAGVEADAPAIAEMGGLAPFLAFNAAVFVVLAITSLPHIQQTLILSSLVVAAGACVTGVLDDLISLRQRFKAFIPFAFSIPLALYTSDAGIQIPLLGDVDFGIWYSVLLVPLAIACASNGFNMLEGFNGLSAGLGIILAAAMAIIIMATGNYTGLVLLFPLVGALVGFLWFNMYPARVFPGDSMTLLVGAVLASAAIVSKVEFWAALLFVPHVVEFLLKARAGFSVQSFATRIQDGVLIYEGPVRSLTHVVMRTSKVTEPQLVVLDEPTSALDVLTPQAHQPRHFETDRGMLLHQPLHHVH